MREIRLTQGQVALVDDEDYDEVSKWKWYAAWQKNSNAFYARKRSGYLHRFLMGYGKGDTRMVDHRDRNPLNNQRSNLRASNHVQNAGNQDVRKGNKSGYKGVYWHIRDNIWIATCGKRHLGSFKDKKDAAKAYDEAAKVAHGEFARLNFPNTVV